MLSHGHAIHAVHAVNAVNAVNAGRLHQGRPQGNIGPPSSIMSLSLASHPLHEHEPKRALDAQVTYPRPRHNYPYVSSIHNDNCQPNLTYSLVVPKTMLG